MADDLAAWNAPPEIQAAFAEDDNDYFSVDPRNWDTLLLFMAVNTQWIPAPAGGAIGLNYAGVDVAIKRLKIKTTPTQFALIQKMERAAVKAMREAIDD